MPSQDDMTATAVGSLLKIHASELACQTASCVAASDCASHTKQELAETQAAFSTLQRRTDYLRDLPFKIVADASLQDKLEEHGPTFVQTIDLADSSTHSTSVVLHETMLSDCKGTERASGSLGVSRSKADEDQAAELFRYNADVLNTQESLKETNRLLLLQSSLNSSNVLEKTQDVETLVPQSTSDHMNSMPWMENACDRSSEFEVAVVVIQSLVRMQQQRVQMIHLHNWQLRVSLRTGGVGRVEGEEENAKVRALEADVQRERRRVQELEAQLGRHDDELNKMKAKMLAMQDRSKQRKCQKNIQHEETPIQQEPSFLSTTGQEEAGARAMSLGLNAIERKETEVVLPYQKDEVRGIAQTGFATTHLEFVDEEALDELNCNHEVDRHERVEDEGHSEVAKIKIEYCDQQTSIEEALLEDRVVSVQSSKRNVEQMTQTSDELLITEPERNVREAHEHLQADLQKYQDFIAPPGDEPKEEKVKGSVGKGIRLMEQEISESELEDDVLRVPAKTEDLERLLQQERTRANVAEVSERYKTAAFKKELEREREARELLSATLEEERGRLAGVAILEAELHAERNRVVDIQSRLDTVLSLQEREQHEREHARREALKAREELRIETESIVALRWEHWHAKDELRKEKEARARDKERMEVEKEQFANAALQLEKRLREAQQHVRLYPLNDAFVRNWEGVEDFPQDISPVHSPTASPRAAGGKSKETTVGEEGKMPSESGHSEAAQTVAAEKSIRALSLQVDALKAENMQMVEERRSQRREASAAGLLKIADWANKVEQLEEEIKTEKMRFEEGERTQKDKESEWERERERMEGRIRMLQIQVEKERKHCLDVQERLGLRIMSLEAEAQQGRDVRTCSLSSTLEEQQVAGDKDVEISVPASARVTSTSVSPATICPSASVAAAVGSGTEDIVLELGIGAERSEAHVHVQGADPLAGQQASAQTDLPKLNTDVDLCTSLPIVRGWVESMDDVEAKLVDIETKLAEAQHKLMSVEERDRTRMAILEADLHLAREGTAELTGKLMQATEKIVAMEASVEIQRAQEMQRNLARLVVMHRELAMKLLGTQSATPDSGLNLCASQRCMTSQTSDAHHLPRIAEHPNNQEKKEVEFANEDQSQASRRGGNPAPPSSETKHGRALLVPRGASAYAGEESGQAASSTSRGVGLRDLRTVRVLERDDSDGEPGLRCKAITVVDCS